MPGGGPAGNQHAHLAADQRSPDACHAAERSAGVARPQLGWPELRDYRDYMIRHLDDSGQVKGYEKQGATVVKAAGQLADRTSDGLLRVEAGADILETDHVVIASGSEAAHPRIDGLGPDRWTCCAIRSPNSRPTRRLTSSLWRS